MNRRHAARQLRASAGHSAVTEYIQSLAEELAELAHSCRLHGLGYMLDISALHARDARPGQKAMTP